MTRKSKQTGGHQPLTHYERTKKFKSSQYGTTTARLSTDSQLQFGDCALSVTAAVDPVATPSGHVYSREAIVEYLMSKTKEIKQAKLNYQAYLDKQQSKQDEEKKESQSQAIVAFEGKQKATTVASKKRPASNPLASTSYWLSEFQPEHTEQVPEPPPERPLSPFSGGPLRLKDLHPLTFERSSDGKVQCAVSHKTITTQPVIALKEHVVSEEVFDSLVKDSMVCPITGRKLKKKHILRLQKAKSGFASSGSVVAKKYRPTIT
jgi:nitric oxide synthase-interacting protein